MEKVLMQILEKLDSMETRLGNIESDLSDVKLMAKRTNDYLPPLQDSGQKPILSLIKLPMTLNS